jgi:hypothetical protein
MAVYDLNTAKGKVTDYGTKKYGRGPENDQEWAAIAQGINYGDGVDDDELNQAYGNADSYAASIGAQVLPGYQAPGQQAPVAPAAPIAPAATPAPAAAPSPDGSVPASQSTPQPPPTTSASPDFVPYAPEAAAVPDNLQALVGELFAQQTPSPIDAQMQEALQALLTRSQAPVSITDPQLQPASDTFRASQQRGANRMRSATAERAAQTGTLDSGGFDTEALGYQQDANFASSMNDSNLVLGEMDKRRDDLRQGISLAMASGQFDKQQALQRQLALLDAAQQQQSFGLSQELGRGDLNLRRELGIGGLELQGRGLDLNRELGLADIGVRQGAVTQQGQLGRGSLALDLIRSLMQNDQFYSGLGLQAGTTQAQLNQDAIMRLLQGWG